MYAYMYKRQWTLLKDTWLVLPISIKLVSKKFVILLPSLINSTTNKLTNG